jgi:hypothetical protein
MADRLVRLVGADDYGAREKLLQHGDRCSTSLHCATWCPNSSPGWQAQWHSQQQAELNALAEDAMTPAQPDLNCK